MSASGALACESAVCLADPDALELSRIITFEDSAASFGPGHQISEPLVLDGAVFGERFAGQHVVAQGNHDRIDGTADNPLTIVPGAPGQNLSIVLFNGTRILNGYGMAGYPKRDGQGEGAISFLFDKDQCALSFQVRGGEDGPVQVTFFARTGDIIATLELPPAGEHHFGFVRAQGISDIAGVVLTNSDPQGIALDNIRFDKNPGLS